MPAKDLSGTSDPYVRVTLLPDKKHRLETKIKRRTLNPRWNETFYFEGKRIDPCKLTIQATCTGCTQGKRSGFQNDCRVLCVGFPIQKLQSRVLHLHVFDYDRFSRDDSIGEMFLPLCQVISIFHFHHSARGFSYYVPIRFSVGGFFGQAVILESIETTGEG